MIPSLTNGTSSQAPSGTQNSGGSSASSLLDPLSTEQSFLQLLVAQLQNQDPLNPQDGTQFVSQLAQMSSLEQELQMREDLDSMNKIMTNQANPQTSSSQSGQTNQTNSTTQP
jgi:flagellar basal-body rod modification protein FlgD